MADLLQAAGLARSTFYYQCNAIQRSEPSSLQVKIHAVYDEHKGRYGYRRITAALCSSLGESVNHNCVQRFMQKMGLRANSGEEIESIRPGSQRFARTERPETRLLREGS